MTTFENWCALHDVQPLPAAPADVAKFVTDCAPLGIEKLWPLIGEISRAHYLVGLADPTLGGWVAHAVNEVSKIEPPRSWPDSDKALFLRLPWDVQTCILKREKQDRDAVHKALQKAANAQKELDAIQQPAKATNGTTSQIPAS